MVARALASSKQVDLAGVQLRDIMAAFSNIGTERLIHTIQSYWMAKDLTQYMARFFTNSIVEMVIQGLMMERHRVES